MMKPLRMFKINGSIVFHTDEQIEKLKKTTQTKEDKKYLEMILSCEVSDENKSKTL